MGIDRRVLEAVRDFRDQGGRLERRPRRWAIVCSFTLSFIASLFYRAQLVPSKMVC